MIQEDYVPFETAKLLKEKGFYVPYYYCSRVYSEHGTLQGNSSVRFPNVKYISAPTLQMAMKWLREIYHIHIIVYPYGEYSCDNYQFDVYKNNNFVVSKNDGYITYEQACETAIKYCLENLI